MNVSEISEKMDIRGVPQQATMNKMKNGDCAQILVCSN